MRDKNLREIVIRKSEDDILKYIKHKLRLELI